MIQQFVGHGVIEVLAARRHRGKGVRKLGCRNCKEISINQSLNQPINQPINQNAAQTAKSQGQRVKGKQRRYYLASAAVPKAAAFEDVALPSMQECLVCLDHHTYVTVKWVTMCDGDSMPSVAHIFFTNERRQGLDHVLRHELRLHTRMA